MPTAILDYIMAKYQPVAIVLYGSYADSTNDGHSDLDALVLTETHDRCHDTSVIEDVQLDVFVYPAESFCGSFDCEEILQIYNGRILLDRDDLAARMQQRVRQHVQEASVKSPEEVRDALTWCRKMCQRAVRRDAEGLFRHHWLLVDSLEICCNVLRQPYFGPKKTLRWLESQYPDTFRQYMAALDSTDPATLTRWVDHLENLNTK